MKRLKGYTLIEMMVVIAIIAVLSGMFIHFYFSYSNYKNKIFSDYSSKYIMIFINSSKQYCNYNNCSGSIIFDISFNTMYFYSDGKCRQRFILPNQCKLYNVSTRTGKSVIYIDNTGFTSDACTITYRDSKSDLHILTISVGTSYVEIKN